MKRLLLLVLLIISVAMIGVKANTTENEIANVQQQIMPFKLYPTQNMWIFIKLDTRNGKMWLVQYSVKSTESCFEVDLNSISLAANSVSGRFELYPTQNMYNFILLDRIDGRTWQTQWSTDPNNIGVIKISR